MRCSGVNGSYNAADATTFAFSASGGVPVLSNTFINFACRAESMFGSFFQTSLGDAVNGTATASHAAHLPLFANPNGCFFHPTAPAGFADLHNAHVTGDGIGGG